MAELSTPPTQPYPAGITFVAITPHHCPGPERCADVKSNRSSMPQRYIKLITFCTFKSNLIAHRPHHHQTSMQQIIHNLVESFHFLDPDFHSHCHIGSLATDGEAKRKEVLTVFRSHYCRAKENTGTERYNCYVGPEIQIQLQNLQPTISTVSQSDDRIIIRFLISRNKRNDYRLNWNSFK